jgi:hypothetical protein
MLVALLSHLLADHVGCEQADDSHFGRERIHGKSCGCAGGKAIMLGLLKLGNSTYAEIGLKAMLQAIIRN